MAVPSVPIPFQRRTGIGAVTVTAIRATEAGVLAGLIVKRSVLGLNRAAPAPTHNETQMGF